VAKEEDFAGYVRDEGNLSAETYNNLQSAIEAHLSDELEIELLIVKDWVLVSATSDVEDVEGYEQVFTHRSRGTALYAVTGLLQWGAETIGAEEYLE